MSKLSQIPEGKKLQCLRLMTRLLNKKEKLTQRFPTQPWATPIPFLNLFLVLWDEEAGLPSGGDKTQLTHGCGHVACCDWPETRPFYGWFSTKRLFQDLLYVRFSEFSLNYGH